MATPAGNDERGSSVVSEVETAEHITYDARVHTPRVLVIDESVRADLFEL